MAVPSWWEWGCCPNRCGGVSVARGGRWPCGGRKAACAGTATRRERRHHADRLHRRPALGGHVGGFDQREPDEMNDQDNNRQQGGGTDQNRQQEQQDPSRQQGGGQQGGGMDPNRQQEQQDTDRQQGGGQQGGGIDQNRQQEQQ